MVALPAGSPEAKVTLQLLMDGVSVHCSVSLPAVAETVPSGV
jgi:hypothetical protein